MAQKRRGLTQVAKITLNWVLFTLLVFTIFCTSGLVQQGYEAMFVLQTWEMVTVIFMSVYTAFFFILCQVVRLTGKDFWLSLFLASVLFVLCWLFTASLFDESWYAIVIELEWPHIIALWIAEVVGIGFALFKRR
jgi:hypothetical protein